MKSTAKCLTRLIFLCKEGEKHIEPCEDGASVGAPAQTSHENFKNFDKKPGNYIIYHLCCCMLRIHSKKIHKMYLEMYNVEQIIHPQKIQNTSQTFCCGVHILWYSQEKSQLWNWSTKHGNELDISEMSDLLEKSALSRFKECASLSICNSLRYVKGQCVSTKDVIFKVAFTSNCVKGWCDFKNNNALAISYVEILKVHLEEYGLNVKPDCSRLEGWLRQLCSESQSKVRGRMEAVTKK